MSDTMSRITLARRPKGAPVPEDFKLETGAVPTPANGEVVIEVTHLKKDVSRKCPGSARWRLARGVRDTSRNHSLGGDASRSGRHDKGGHVFP